MRRRHRNTASRRASRGCLLALLGGVLLAATIPPTTLAADRVLAHDSHIGQVLALDGRVVYYRSSARIRPQRARPWMRIVNGRVSRARGMAPIRAGETDWAASIGLDDQGRVVVPFTRAQIVHDVLRSQEWWVYDVAADRSRPLRGLPSNLDDCSELSLWRDRLAYDTCRYPYLRVGHRTRRVPIPRGRFLEFLVGQGSGALTLRGSTLFGQVDDGSDGIYLSLLADASGFCRRLMPGLTAGDAGGGLSGWWPTRRFLTWRTGGYDTATGPPNTALAGARLRGHCRTPGPAGLLFVPPANTGVWAVDDRFVYYGDANTIRRHPLPTRPSTSPPSNDAFERATPLSGDAPLSITGVVGAATRQAGEPLVQVSYPPVPATRTVWFAFRPATSATDTVTITTSWAMFTGPALQALMPVAAGQYDPVRVEVAAGQTYWIAVGSASVFPDYSSFTVALSPAR